MIEQLTDLESEYETLVFTRDASTDHARTTADLGIELVEGDLSDRNVDGALAFPLHEETHHHQTTYDGTARASAVALDNTTSFAANIRRTEPDFGVTPQTLEESLRENGWKGGKDEPAHVPGWEKAMQ